MLDPSPMFYAEIAPDPRLKPWVAAHWTFRVDPGAGEIEHTIPLSGAVSLAFAHGQAVLVGPRVTPLHTVVRGGDVFWGTLLWPGAAGSLLGCAMEPLREESLPAAQVLDGTWVANLTTALGGITDETRACQELDRALLTLAASAGPLDERMMTAIFRLLQRGGQGSLPELAREVSLSPRQFRRRFRAAVGLTAKELARIRRLRTSAVELVEEAESWVNLAADHGYADQAHLVREYGSLLGLTPQAFERHIRRIEHGRLLY